MTTLNQDNDYIGFNIESDIKKQFRLICVEQDETMSEVLLRYIRSYIKNNKKTAWCPNTKYKVNI
jgi:hypothetical protein